MKYFCYADYESTPKLSSKWRIRFQALAEHIATWSKDPNRKVGAVIVSDRKMIRGVGYNGLPRGLCDNKISAEDHIHAEVNAVLNARSNVQGCALFTTTFPCTPCAAVLIQAGISAVHTSQIEPHSSWLRSQIHAQHMFNEAGVEVAYVE